MTSVISNSKAKKHKDMEAFLNKILLNAKIKYATLCMAAVGIFSTTLLCMDKPDVGLVQDDLHVILSLLKSRLDYFDHHTLCVLAINKEWNKLLRDTAPERKKTFIKLQASLDPFVARTYQTIWHKYGSAFGNRRELRGFDGNRLWNLQGGYLRGNGSIPHNYERIKSAQGTIDFVEPKFNERGDFVYYGVTKDASSHTILEYRYPEDIPCWLLLKQYNLSKHFIKMAPFVAFHNLLKVFLNNLEIHVNGIFKFCDLQKVIIPNNYKECAPNDEYKSYNELPKFWREVIDKRYNEQQKNSLG